MIPELGHFALILALSLALLQAVLPIAGAARDHAPWTAVARPAASGQAFFLLVALACLAWASATNDFSVRYIAAHSNSMLPLHYRIAAVWGGHEGSLLLWAAMLGGWSAAVSVLSRQLPERFVARVLGVMGLIATGFLLFMLLTSNPFERLLPPPSDGADLNPLLQDPALVLHPPFLYMGYVGFSVAFAFAIAALIEGRLDFAWARWSRPWTTAAWAFLTVGIGLGSFWAYYELGWGGWWFWDPVENASFMPWLAGTALIHSLAVSEKRGAFKSWTVLLAIIAFSLSLLGTFLVRSGVLISVHAFASDPARGMFILAFLVTVVGGSLALYAWRAPAMGLGGNFHWLSREALLLANNVLLMVALATVLLGTLYPLILDALGLGKISVGPPYFDSVFVPIMSPLLLFMGLAPFARWKHTRPLQLFARLRGMLPAAAAVAMIAPWLLGEWSLTVALGLFLATWVAMSVLLDVHDTLQRREAHWPQAKKRMSRSHLAMALAHFGVALFVFGATISGGYSVEQERVMAPGERAHLRGYDFAFDGVQVVRGPNYTAAEGRVNVTRGERLVAELKPQKRAYDVQQRTMTEAAIDAGMTRHLYVALGEPAQGEAWSVRLYVKPFVQFIWVGVLLVGVGGVLAVSDRRYRLARLRAGAAAKNEDARIGTVGIAP